VHKSPIVSDEAAAAAPHAATKLIVAAALLFAGDVSAADVELSSSPFRIDGVLPGGRAGTCVVDARGSSSPDSPALLISAYLADVGADVGAGSAYVLAGSGAPGVISVASAAVQIDADQALARLGYAASARGDWNDDGNLDVALGAWSADGDDFDNGAVYVFFGGAAFTGNLSVASADVILTGNDEVDHFGWSLDIAHDVNGDAIPDLVVGAPLAQGNGVSTGAVYVFFGGESRTAGTELVAADAELTFVGSEPEAGVGSAVACGEINGVLPAEIAIGAPNMDFSGRFNAGAVFLIEGDEFLVPGTTVILETGADRLIIGEGNNDAFGTFVGVARVNDDPKADVIVGSPLARVGSNNFRGRAYVFESPDLRGVPLDSATDATSRLLGLSTGELFGVSCAAVGDLDGDGFREFVIGSPGVNRSGRDACGAAYVYRGDGGFPPSGDADLADWTYIGSAAGDEAGASVVGISDFDLDGSPDLVVGSPGFNGQAGAAYVVTGSGAVDVADGLSATFMSAPRPNPFTRTVAIHVDGASATHVDIFDAGGRRVRVLDPSGSSVTWDGRDTSGHQVSPGVYYLRLRGAVDGSTLRHQLSHRVVDFELKLGRGVAHTVESRPSHDGHEEQRVVRPHPLAYQGFQPRLTSAPVGEIGVVVEHRSIAHHDFVMGGGGDLVRDLGVKNPALGVESGFAIERKRRPPRHLFHEVDVAVEALEMGGKLEAERGLTGAVTSDERDLHARSSLGRVATSCPFSRPSPRGCGL
jgi:hypothetical protein